MIHPDTVLKYINKEIGYGVFASQLIPKGTITYVKDDMEIELDGKAFEALSPTMQQQAEKYSYRDAKGLYILSWDFAKYVNHCCDPNTMSTGYGFEIAIRDILPGEEITDEYGLFNLEVPFEVTCKKEKCRGCVLPNDIDTYSPLWDAEVKKALNFLFKVEQPLFPLIDGNTKKDLEAFRQNPDRMLSVSGLKFNG